MTRTGKWLAATGALVLLMAAGAWWLLALIPPERALADGAAARLSHALGAPVTIGALRWQVLPVPLVEVDDAVIGQDRPITLRRLTLYPDMGALWNRRVKFRRAELYGAVVPQLSLRGLGKSGELPAGGRFTADDQLLERFVFREVSWISRRGIAVLYEGEVDFDSAWRPRLAQLRRPAFKPLTDISLERQGEQDRWTARVHLGGGSAHGSLQLQALANGQLRLSGKLQPRQVEVSAALSAFNRRPALAGSASGETTLLAEGTSAFALAQSLRTSTAFVMGRSTLLRFDLDKAIRSIGKEHGGQTTLEGITGTLQTQNGPDGMAIDFKNVQATSGSLKASGKARLFNQQVEAEFAVDLVDGLVGVPLKVSGPVSSPRISVPTGSVVGAVVGTAVLPGIGTAIGARLGATIGKIFSPSSAADKPAGNAAKSKVSPRGDP